MAFTLQPLSFLKPFTFSATTNIWMTTLTLKVYKIICLSYSTVVKAIANKSWKIPAPIIFQFDISQREEKFALLESIIWSEVFLWFFLFFFVFFTNLKIWDFLWLFLFFFVFWKSLQNGGVYHLFNSNSRGKKYE